MTTLLEFIDLLLQDAKMAGEGGWEYDFLSLVSPGCTSCRDTFHVVLCLLCSGLNIAEYEAY